MAAAHLGGVAATTALLGAVFLAVTDALARLLPTPQRLPLAVALTGTTAAFVWHAKIAASAGLCRHCARLSHTALPRTAEPF